MDIGALGENIAFRYLLSAGYKVIARNYREGFDEIDIIGIDSSNKLIFFEVKSRLIKNEHFIFFTPEDNFSFSKSRRIIRICQKFVAKHPFFIKDDIGWQIDLIAISLKGSYFYDLKHYKNCV